jgi:uncharacterized protein (TIGR04255 family)
MYNLESKVAEAALNFKTLSKAPIKEALIAVRLQPGSSSDLAALESAFNALPDDYQTARSPNTLSQTQLNLAPNVPPSANIEQRQLGWRFGTKSGKYAVQARSDGFIFSHLAPYSEWPIFSTEARSIWAVLRECYPPLRVQAVSVRTINELSLAQKEHVERYLKFYINVPPGIPQEFRNYFARLELIQAEDTIATLQSGLLPPLPDRVPLLLDIEVTKTVSPKTEKELWQAIDSLREPKNQIFFGCITEEWESKLR